MKTESSFELNECTNTSQDTKMQTTKSEYPAAGLDTARFEWSKLIRYEQK